MFVSPPPTNKGGRRMSAARGSASPRVRIHGTNNGNPVRNTLMNLGAVQGRGSIAMRRKSRKATIMKRNTIVPGGRKATASQFAQLKQLEDQSREYEDAERLSNRIKSFERVLKKMESKSLATPHCDEAHGITSSKNTQLFMKLVRTRARSMARELAEEYMDDLKDEYDSVLEEHDLKLKTGFGTPKKTRHRILNMWKGIVNRRILIDVERKQLEEWQVRDLLKLAEKEVSYEAHNTDDNITTQIQSDTSNKRRQSIGVDDVDRGLESIASSILMGGFDSGMLHNTAPARSSIRHSRMKKITEVKSSHKSSPNSSPKSSPRRRYSRKNSQQHYALKKQGSLSEKLESYSGSFSSGLLGPGSMKRSSLNATPKVTLLQSKSTGRDKTNSILSHIKKGHESPKKITKKKITIMERKPVPSSLFLTQGSSFNNDDSDSDSTDSDMRSDDSVEEPKLANKRTVRNGTLGLLGSATDSPPLLGARTAMLQRMSGRQSMRKIDLDGSFQKAGEKPALVRMGGRSSMRKLDVQDSPQRRKSLRSQLIRMTQAGSQRHTLLHAKAGKPPPLVKHKHSIRRHSTMLKKVLDDN